MKSKKITKNQKIRKNSNQTEFYSIVDQQSNEQLDVDIYIPVVLTRTTNQIYVTLETTNGELPLQIIQARQNITLLPYQSYKIYFGCKITQLPVPIIKLDPGVIFPNQQSILRYTPSENLQVNGILSTCKSWHKYDQFKKQMFITITNFTNHVITSHIGNKLGYLQLYSTRKYIPNVDPYTPQYVDNRKQRKCFITSTCVDCFDNSDNYQFSNLQNN